MVVLSRGGMQNVRELITLRVNFPCMGEGGGVRTYVRIVYVYESVREEGWTGRRDRAVCFSVVGDSQAGGCVGGSVCVCDSDLPTTPPPCHELHDKILLLLTRTQENDAGCSARKGPRACGSTIEKVGAEREEGRQTGGRENGCRKDGREEGFERKVKSGWKAERTEGWGGKEPLCWAKEDCESNQPSHREIGPRLGSEAS